MGPDNVVKLTILSFETTLIINISIGGDHHYGYRLVSHYVRLGIQY